MTIFMANLRNRVVDTFPPGSERIRETYNTKRQDVALEPSANGGHACRRTLKMRVRSSSDGSLDHGWSGMYILWS